VRSNNDNTFLNVTMNNKRIHKLLIGKDIDKMIVWAKIRAWKLVKQKMEY